MKTEKLARRVAEIKHKIAKAETALRLLRGDLDRTERRYTLAVAGTRIEAGKKHG